MTYPAAAEGAGQFLSAHCTTKRGMGCGRSAVRMASSSKVPSPLDLALFQSLEPSSRGFDSNQRPAAALSDCEATIPDFLVNTGTRKAGRLDQFIYREGKFTLETICHR